MDTNEHLFDRSDLVSALGSKAAFYDSLLTKYGVNNALRIAVVGDTTGEEEALGPEIDLLTEPGTKEDWDGPVTVQVHQRMGHVFFVINTGCTNLMCDEYSYAFLKANCPAEDWQ